MALTPERITELSDRLLRVVGAGYVRPQDADGFARAIESEVRKQDTELIRQLVEALESVDGAMPFPVARQVLKVARARMSPPAAVTAARARKD